VQQIENTEQAAAWNGAEGEHWAEQSGRDGDVNAELTGALFAAAAIAPADRVLDVGCGAGETTRLAARQARNGYAVGIDLSTPMLDRARVDAASAGIGNVSFENGDAQVYPFAAGSFDVAISRFGIMFFADPVAAFANLRRALRARGRLAFVCPQSTEHNDWYAVPLAALERRLGGDPAAEAAESGMFSLADPVHLTEMLTAAGFTRVRTEPIEVPMAFGPDAETAADFYAGSGPVLALLQRHGESARDLVRETLIDALRPYQSAAGVRIPGAHWLVTANRP
jgi:ubiquinone/menaquinone biosynthesis C-methylase UbiE